MMLSFFRMLEGKKTTRHTIHFLRFDFGVYARGWTLKSAYLPADIPYPPPKDSGVGADGSGKLSVDSAGKGPCA